MRFPLVARSTYELALAQIAELSVRCSELEQRIYMQQDNALINAGKSPVSELPRAKAAARAAKPRWSVDTLGAALERRQREKAVGLAQMEAAKREPN
jgi:hypothetical protein